MRNFLWALLCLFSLKAFALPDPAFIKFRNEWCSRLFSGYSFEATDEKALRLENQKKCDAANSFAELQSLAQYTRIACLEKVTPVKEDHSNSCQFERSIGSCHQMSSNLENLIRAYQDGLKAAKRTK